MTLHEAIEQVIRQAGRPLSTREICDLINSQNLYSRKDGKPVPTSQIGARVRQSPQWVKKVGNLITVANNTKKPELKPIKKVVKQTSTSSNTSINAALVIKQLINSKKFKSAKNIEHLVPDSPGLYMIKIKKPSSLSKTFRQALEARNHNTLYIGIATKSLKKRMHGQELRAKGHGTFFRSIGAVLGHTPPKGSQADKINKRNYKFSNSHEQEIIAWINENLTVNWVECESHYSEIETLLINACTPIINIAKNPYAIKELSDLRRKCVEIANN